MTPDAYRKAIGSLGLTQVGAAKLFGVDPRTSRRWALGEKDVPIPVEFTLLLMLRHGIDADQLRRWANEGI